MLKRKRVVLTLQDKLNIIDLLKKGHTGRKLADKYCVGTSTISDIKKNAFSILKYASKLDDVKGSKLRKTRKKPKNEVLEDTLYYWFLDKRSKGEAISGPMLCKKALQFNKKIRGDKSFVASTGWLHRFKRRHGIREFEMQGEKREEKVNNLNLQNKVRPSNEEAFQALDTAVKWFETLTGCNSVTLLHLKRLRDIAAKKIKDDDK